MYMLCKIVRAATLANTFNEINKILNFLLEGLNETPCNLFLLRFSCGII